MANSAHSHAKRSGRTPGTAKPAAAQQGATRTPGAKAAPRGSTTHSGKAAAPRPATNSVKSSVANGTNGAKATTQSGRLAAIRERAGQGAPQKGRAQVRRGQQKPWYQGMGAIWAVLGLVLAALLVFLIVAHNGSGDAYYTRVSSTVFNEVTQVNPNVLNKVGNGGITQPLDAAPANTALLKDASGKPLVLYVGAEYCPYCAAERWSMIIALSRFGTFSNLHNMVSSDNEGDIASLPTFTFRGATYTSPYLAFQSVETLDRYQQATLETLSNAQSQVFHLYDFPPYVASSNSGGGIPFVSIGDQYFVHSAGYLPQVITSSTREEIAGNLSNPNSPVTQSIVGNANYLTAAFCKITNNQPANVCTTDPSSTLKNAIPALQAQLPAPTK
jgi:hypothetical protein